MQLMISVKFAVRILTTWAQPPPSHCESRSLSRSVTHIGWKMTMNAFIVLLFGKEFTMLHKSVTKLRSEMLYNQCSLIYYDGVTMNLPHYFVNIT